MEYLKRDISTLVQCLVLTWMLVILSPGAELKHSREDSITCGELPLMRDVWFYEREAFCRVKNKTGSTDPRILQGRDAEAGQFPSYVRVKSYYKDQNKTELDCGGALIDKDLVLVAGHCLRRRKDAMVRSVLVMAGSLNSEGYTLENTQVRFGKTYCMHPHYIPYNDSKNIIASDLAVVRLHKPFRITDHVQPACLATLEPKENAECYLVSYGGEIVNSTSTKLSYTTMERNCQHTDWLSDEEIEMNNLMGTTCFNPTSTGNPCKGDGGGPIYCMSSCIDPNQKLKQYLVGVVSMITNAENCQTMPSAALVSDVHRMRDSLDFMQKHCHNID